MSTTHARYVSMQVRQVFSQPGQSQPTMHSRQARRHSLQALMHASLATASACGAAAASISWKATPHDVLRPVSSPAAAAGEENTPVFRRRKQLGTGAFPERVNVEGRIDGPAHADAERRDQQSEQALKRREEPRQQARCRHDDRDRRLEHRRGQRPRVTREGRGRRWDGRRDHPAGVFLRKAREHQWRKEPGIGELPVLRVSPASPDRRDATAFPVVSTRQAACEGELVSKP